MSYILEANTPPPVVIHLDSRKGQQLQTGLTTNFLYTLKEPLLVPDHMSLLLSLHTATIPYSFYNVGTHNNTIAFYVAGVSKPLVLDDGNYSASTILNLMKTHLELESNITLASISYSRESLKYKFSYTGSASSLLINFGESSASDLIGITETTSMTAGQIKTSQNAVDLNDAIHGLYVRQNLATKGTLDTDEGTFSNILARIPINTNAGGIIFMSPTANQHETMISVPLVQTIGIRLTDDKHRTINLNGLHFQLSLKLSYIHREKLRTLPIRRPNIKINDTKSKKN
tara:strand:+ start:573 stop:1433 length:861 start_codon:yes stop_codon:yes gene_type:complete